MCPIVGERLLKDRPIRPTHQTQLIIPGLERIRGRALRALGALPSSMAKHADQRSSPVARTHNAGGAVESRAGSCNMGRQLEAEAQINRAQVSVIKPSPSMTGPGMAPLSPSLTRFGASPFGSCAQFANATMMIYRTV